MKSNSKIKSNRRSFDSPSLRCGSLRMTSIFVSESTRRG
jgi:hypothetical protein